MVRILVGKTIVEQEAEALERLRAPYGRVVIDLGTGDGRFALRGAREEPESLYLAIDAVADNMIPTAQKARKKPGKGGAPNALFVVSSIEQLPPVFDGWADELHVGYPWGSLLAAFVEPDVALLTRIFALARPGAAVHIRLNYSVFEDAEYMTRLELPPFDAERSLDALRAAGLSIGVAEIIAGDSGERSTWERRLVAGSHRKTYRVEAVREPAGPPDRRPD